MPLSPMTKHNQIMAGMYVSGQVEIKRDEFDAEVQD
jgi:hypothetical protein